MAIRATFWSRPAGRRWAICLAAGTLAAATAWGGEKTDPSVAPSSTQQQTPRTPLRAVAGDDRSVSVGDRVTLDGRESMPLTGLSYRWIAAGGPPVRLSLEDRHLLTWVPESPGLYRFALVVAGGGEISEPDYVEIRVAESPKKTSADPVAASTASQALRALEASEPIAGEFAEIAERIATRVDLYDSYNVLLHELSRSLDALLPPDRESRARWNERLFVPLSGLLVERLRVESLDLSRPGSLDSTLTDAQKAALATFFREVAAGSRAFRDGAR